MRPSEAITALELALEGVKEHLKTIDKAEVARADAEVKLNAAKQELDQVNSQLSQAKNTTEQTQQAIAQRYAVEEQKKIAELRGLEGQIEVLKAELIRLDDETKSVRVTHDQVLASLQSLRKQLGV